MKKELLIVGTIFMIFTIGLRGSVDEKSKFIGSWETAGGETITFYNNNTVVITDVGMFGFVELSGPITYTIANQHITFSVVSIGETLNYSFPDSNTLIRSNDQGLSLTSMKMYSASKAMGSSRIP
jgi:hypothetical protein